MKKFVFEYYGNGKRVRPEDVSQEDWKKINDKWMAWFATFKDKMVDGGNRFAPDAKVVNAKGVETISQDKWPATGYTIINVKSMDEATTIAQGCPALEIGGTVRVYEAMPM